MEMLKKIIEEHKQSANRLPSLQEFREKYPLFKEEKKKGSERKMDKKEYCYKKIGSKGEILVKAKKYGKRSPSEIIDWQIATPMYFKKRFDKIVEKRSEKKRKRLKNEK